MEMPSWIEKRLPNFMRKGREKVDIRNKTKTELEAAAERGLEIEIDGDNLIDGVPTAKVNKVVIKGNTED
ncbi:hypothetical protein HZB69_00310 [Candidatus Amesbacteria bacterium]|nr:hypothetical protein [Candidatus Amesbacteria bacterium]